MAPEWQEARIAPTQPQPIIGNCSLSPALVPTLVLRQMSPVHTGLSVTHLPRVTKLAAPCLLIFSVIFPLFSVTQELAVGPDMNTLNCNFLLGVEC